MANSLATASIVAAPFVVLLVVLVLTLGFRRRVQRRLYAGTGWWSGMRPSAGRRGRIGGRWRAPTPAAARPSLGLLPLRCAGPRS